MINMYLKDAADLIQASHYGGNPMFIGCCSDSRCINPDEMFIALKGDRFDGHDFLEQVRERGARVAMLERESEIIPSGLLVSDTRKAMGQLAGKWREKFPIPLVAITGSNGKTTVKEMLSCILVQHAPVLYSKGNLNNDIGVPITLFNLGSEHKYAVIEMGANHTGEISWLSHIAKPDIALITQCAPAHLEGFGSVEGVARAKAEIYEGMSDKGTAIINVDDNHAEIWLAKTKKKRQLTFGITNDADISAEDLETHKNSDKTEFTLAMPNGKTDIRLSLLGLHNVMNALAATACAYSLDIPVTLIKSGLERFKPVSGRLEIRKGIKGSRIIDDSYNANPSSLNAAINVLSDFKPERWLVLGDMGELGDEAENLHAEAGIQAKSSGVKRLFTLGILSSRAQKSFGENATHYTTHNELIRDLQSDINPDVTLLVKGSRSMHLEKIIEALTEKN